MREIRFRGRRLSDNSWIHGGLVTEINVSLDEVDPGTVGQFTGLEDATGIGVYDGDILQDLGGKGFVRVVRHQPPVFYKYPVDKWSIEHGIKETIVFPTSFLASEVIGNIHDNPDLL